METSAVAQWAENKGVDNKGGSDIGLHMTELSRESFTINHVRYQSMKALIRLRY